MEIVKDAERLRKEGFSAGLPEKVGCVGVVALLDRGLVVYVKGSKNVWSWLGNLFKTKKRGKGIGDTKLGYEWGDVKEFEFDEVLIKYCFVDELMQVESDLIMRYRPEYNITLKPRPTKVWLGKDVVASVIEKLRA